MTPARSTSRGAALVRDDDQLVFHWRPHPTKRPVDHHPGQTDHGNRRECRFRPESGPNCRFRPQGGRPKRVGLSPTATATGSSAPRSPPSWRLGCKNQPQRQSCG